MFVACSTLCFGRYPLHRALRVISELEFSKVDVAIHERGPHLRPSQVEQDIHEAAQQVRSGPSLSPVVFSAAIDAPDERTHQQQFRSVCRLARMCTVPVLTIPSAAAGSNLDVETRRLRALVDLAEADGILLAVETRQGTLAELPATAIELCERVDGLGLSLDPSHYIAAPNQGRSYDAVYPYVRHIRLRDTGRGPEQFQVRIGQGEIEYSRIVSMLSRYRYERALSVDIHDIPDAAFAMEPEVRKLKYLLESVV